jgi:hypothetical protein
MNLAANYVVAIGTHYEGERVVWSTPSFDDAVELANDVAKNGELWEDQRVIVYMTDPSKRPVIEPGARFTHRVVVYTAWAEAELEAVPPMDPDDGYVANDRLVAKALSDAKYEVYSAKWHRYGRDGNNIGNRNHAKEARNKFYRALRSQSREIAKHYVG